MKNAKAPAFPSNHDYYHNTSAVVNPGLTKREYLAALAMQGMLAGATSFSLEHKERVADVAIHFADELLKQLDNETHPTP